MNLKKWLVVVTMMLFVSEHLMAQSFSRRGHLASSFSRNQPTVVHVNKLLQAAKQTQLLQNSQGYRAKAELRKTYYTIKIVSMKIRNYEAKEALAVAAEKLNDPYLNVSEKIEWALDCMGIAITSLVVNSPMSTRAGGIKKLARLGNILTKACLFSQAAQVFSAVQNLTYKTVGCTASGLAAVEEALYVISEKLNDPYLNGREKISFVDDCVSVIFASI